MSTDFLSSTPDKLLPCVILLDVSMSMTMNISDNFSRLSALINGLEIFKTEINQDDYAREHVEVSFMTFGSSVEVVQDWTIAKNLPAIPNLRASGATPLGEAFISAVEACEQRKRYYIREEIERYCPWIIIISDGQPTSSPDIWKRATDLAAEVRAKKKAFVTCVAIDDCPMDKLRELSDEPGLTFELSSHSFREFFRWLSKSISNSIASGGPIKQDFIEPSFQ